jgi:LEA14-like dessication related protein
MTEKEILVSPWSESDQVALNRPWHVVIRVALGLCLAVVAAGCATTNALEEMEITLTGLEFTEATLFETTIVAKIRVANPNPDPLSFEGASFKLFLDDRKVGTGLAPEPFTVDRLATSLVDVTFHINNATAIFRIVEVLKDKREVGYGVRGSLFTDASLGGRKLKVEKMGTLDLENLEVPHSIEPPSSKLEPGEI